MSENITGTQRERYDKTIRRKEKLAGFLYDLAKACFTLMVIAGIVLFFTEGFTWNIVGLAVFGIWGTFIFSWFANRILIF